MDLNTGLELSENLFIRASIKNLFDKAPPAVFGSKRGFDSINHDAFGTTYQIGLSAKF